MQTVTIMRGVPGSGKTTQAVRIAAETPGTVVVSADDYFTVAGHYFYNGSAIGDAHRRVHRLLASLLGSGLSVVVDNTHTQFWEMRESVKIARNIGAEVRFFTTPMLSADELAARCLHKVPADKIQVLIDRFQPLPPSAHHAEILDTIIAAKAPWEK